MEDKLRDQASTWTLQNDDDLRRKLEDLRDNVTGTASHLTVNIGRLHDKLLNTDCGVEQLNTQLDLLKNAKFVENVVEDEDSRPKPAVPIVQKTKEEMVQIVVDAVKTNLNKIVGQLSCDRRPLLIETIPCFNHPDFATSSFVPSGYKWEPGPRQENISTNLIEPQLPQAELPSPSYIQAIDSQLEQKPLGPPLNGIIKPIVANIPSDSEDDMDYQPQNEIITSHSMPSVPAVPEMPKFNGIQPKPAQPGRTRNLFSSDDEDEEENEVLPVSHAPVPHVTTTMKDDFMEQLAAKLKSKEAKLDEEQAPTPEKQPTPDAQKSAEPPVEEPSVAKPPKVEIMRKRHEPKPAQPTPSVRTTASASVAEQSGPKPAPVKEENLPSTSKQPAKVEVQRAGVAESSKPVARPAAKKTKGLFSDSDSDEEFIVPKTMQQPKPDVKIGQRKVEMPKSAANKSISTKKKSIFDSDSSDEDSFAGFLRKPVTQEKKFSTGLVTQRKSRSPSPVKEEAPKPSAKKEPRLVKAEPLPESAKVEPAVQRVPEEQPKLPEPSTAVTHTPAVERRPSPEPSTSSDPLSVYLLSEELKAPKRPIQKEVVVVAGSTPRKTSRRSEEKETEPVVVKPQTSPPVREPERRKTPEPVVVPKEITPPPTVVRRKTPSPDLSVREAPPPVPEASSRSESPPEEDNSRSDQGPLEQENLPPIPTQEFPSDSPPELTMPAGKTPGKLNNAGFAAMLGSKLQAGPPATRQSTSLMSTSATSIAETPSPSTPSDSRGAHSSSTTSPSGLCHLTKSRPRRPGVHRPTLHKASGDDKDKDAAPAEKVNNGMASMKVSSTPPVVKKESAIAAAATVAAKARATKSSSTEKSPTIVKRTSSSLKVDNGTAKETAKPSVNVSSKTETMPAIKPNIISASASKTLPAKKGLFDFSSSDEEQLTTPPKITKAASTLKTSVTSTSSSTSTQSKTPSSSSVTSASKTTAGSTATGSTASTTSSSKPAIRGLNKYKSMFNDDDDLDVSMFKKN